MLIGYKYTYVVIIPEGSCAWIRKTKGRPSLKRLKLSLKHNYVPFGDFKENLRSNLRRRPDTGANASLLLISQLK